jgi:putative hydrolase of the HAD superfamily
VIRAVLFDLDGTLFDHHAAAEAGISAHLSAELPDLEREQLAELVAEWRRLEDHHFEQYLAGALSFLGQRRARVRGVLGAPEMTDAAADAWFARYWARYAERWAAFPDVVPLLDALAERDPSPKVGIVTNGTTEFQHAKLAALGLTDRFEIYVDVSHTGAAKPEAAIFLHACERLGVAPGETAYVGDLLDVDAVGATRAGLRGIWLARAGDAATAPEGIEVVRGLDELAALLWEG